MDEEFNLFGGNMLSEEQFHKMMADEGTAIDRERAQLASTQANPGDNEPPLDEVQRNRTVRQMDMKRDANEGMYPKPLTELYDDMNLPPPAQAPAHGNDLAQLRFLPRGSGAPSELPYTPSPPLVPEVTPRLPTPPQPGPFRPLPDGPAPETPFRRLPTPPRPRLDASLDRPNAIPSEQQDMQDKGRQFMLDNYDERRDRNERPMRQPEEVLNPPPSAPPPAPGNKLASPFDNAVQLAQVYGPRENRYPDAGRLPQQYRDKQTDAPMIDFGQGRRTPQEKKEPREDYLDSLKKNEGFGMSPNELRRQQVVPPPTFDERFNVPPPDKPNPPLAQGDEERYSPETAQMYLRQGATLERTNRRLAAENGPQPNVVQRFAGDFLNGAMALLPPGAPRGATPFGRAGVRFGAPEAPVRPGNDAAPPDVATPQVGRDQPLTDEAGRPIGAGSRPRAGTGYDTSTLKPGQPPIPTRMRNTGKPTSEQAAALDAEENRYLDRGQGPGRSNQGENQKTFVQGNRTYSESTGEYGRSDSALRSVKRTGVPPEEQQTKNLDAFPEGYFDRVPRERRQMGAGLSHPGFRWQIMENGNPIGTPQMNKMKANARADKMTSTYNTRYTVAPRPAGESELTTSERSYLQKYEINIPRNTQ